MKVKINIYKKQRKLLREYKRQKLSGMQSRITGMFQLKILNKYDVEYYLCSDCGLLQTETLFRLGEAYNTAIADIDTGVINRNLIN